ATPAAAAGETAKTRSPPVRSRREGFRPEPMNSTLFLATLNLSLGGLVFLLGFVILRENSSSRLNRVVAQMLFFGGLGAIFGALGMLAARAGAAAQTVGNVLQNVSYVWEFFFPSLFVFASLFPEERAFTRR